ncbi:MAG: type III secretion protein J [Lentisphaeria bacterium]|jgi:type III secretion protein J
MFKKNEIYLSVTYVNFRNICRIFMIFILVLVGGCKQELYSGLSEYEANEMLAILLRSGIGADKLPVKDDLFSLQVEKDKLPDAVEVLKSQGYPKETYQNMGDVFKKEGLISSPLEERVRFIYALSQNVAETLTQIDGVITARVNIVMPENNPFGEATSPSSASVFIKYRPESRLENVKSDIKLIVEKSIEGLSYDKVSVIMLPAAKLPNSTTYATAAATGSSTLGWVLWALGGIILVCFGALKYASRSHSVATTGKLPLTK